MIEVLLIRNVFEGAKDAERGTLEWHPDLRVRETVPPDWEHLRDDLVPFTGIRRLAWDDEVEEGTRIAFALAPRGIDPATLAFFIFIQIASAIVMRALLPKPPRQREDNSSATYGYNGIEASRVEGEPIPLYYGELRVGGQIINEFVDDFGNGDVEAPRTEQRFAPTQFVEQRLLRRVDVHAAAVRSREREDAPRDLDALAHERGILERADAVANAEHEVGAEVGCKAVNEQYNLSTHSWRWHKDEMDDARCAWCDVRWHAGRTSVCPAQLDEAEATEGEA